MAATCNGDWRQAVATVGRPTRTSSSTGGSRRKSGAVRRPAGGRARRRSSTRPRGHPQHHAAEHRRGAQLGRAPRRQAGRRCHSPVRGRASAWARGKKFSLMVARAQYAPLTGARRRRRLRRVPPFGSASSLSTYRRPHSSVSQSLAACAHTLAQPSLQPASIYRNGAQKQPHRLPQRARKQTRWPQHCWQHCSYRQLHSTHRQQPYDTRTALTRLML